MNYSIKVRAMESAMKRVMQEKKKVTIEIPVEDYEYLYARAKDYCMDNPDIKILIDIIIADYIETEKLYDEEIKLSYEDSFL